MSPRGRPRIPLGSRRKPVPREVLWLLGFVLGDLAAYAIDTGSFTYRKFRAFTAMLSSSMRSLDI
jgi:hypothetical protein